MTGNTPQNSPRKGTQKLGLNWRIMGIDYGSRRVGIALTDESRTIAVPKAVLPNDRMLFTEIKNMVAGHDVREIVMGESKNFKGEDNKIMEGINFFKGELERELQLPVHLQPEYLTSFEASRTQGGNSPLLDASAAALILQSFLDKK
jgi:putative Holliday junction resolvase